MNESERSGIREDGRKSVRLTSSCLLKPPPPCEADAAAMMAPIAAPSANEGVLNDRE